MNVKRQIDKIVKDTFIRRSRKKQLHYLKKLIDHLKVKKSFVKYPIKKYPPVIKRYSFYHYSDLKWLDFYFSVFGSPDPSFIPVPIYYYVETCLNHRMLTYAIKDKNFLNKFMPTIPTPGTIIRCINGFYYNDKFQKIDINQVWQLLNQHDKFILKPSIESGGGSSIRVFEKRDSGFLDDKDNLNAMFFDGYGKDFIIQEYIVQHGYFSQFNPSSNNTIRVFTYRSVKDDSVNLLHCLFRVGAKGSYLDHDHLGGVVLSIDEHNKISPHAIDIYGNKYKSVNGIEFSNLDSVPAMAEIRKLAKEIAGNIYYGRLLALDFTVSSECVPLMLEINCWRNGISQYQMHDGGLFKEFTEEILDYCQKEKFTYTLSI